MLAITCEKCRRRYTATDEELRVYLQQAEGKKFAQVLCPHCGKPNKIAENRIRQALRFSQPAEGQAHNQPGDQQGAAATGSDVIPGKREDAGLGGPPSAGGIANTGSVPEEENPPA